MVGVLRHRLLVQAEVDLGREDQQPRRSYRLDPFGVLEEDRVGQPASARVAGEEDPLAGDAPVDQLRIDGGGVLRAGGVGELGGEAVVRDEDGAAGLAAHLRGEERIHVRGGTDVPTSVQVEHEPLGRLGTRHIEDPGNAPEFDRVALDVEGADDGRHDPLADVVEHELERAEFGDAQ